MPVATFHNERSGPTVDLFVGVDARRRRNLTSCKFPVPERIRIRAILDTGSAVTAIDVAVLAQLDLRAIGEIELFTPSTGRTPHRCQEFLASLSLLHDEMEMHFPQESVISAIFDQGDGIQALIGRNILAHCLFVYNGPEDEFSLAW